MRCILHIGTEKTGSTSIQGFLLKNREALQTSGVHVCTSAGKGNNRALPAAFMSDNKKDDYINQHKFEHANARQLWKDALCESIVTEVQQARRSASVFLISSEHFHSRLQKVDEVVALHAFLSPLFDEIKVFCYLRRQDQMAVSRYSQSLKAGLTPGALLPRGVIRRGQGIRRYFDFRALFDRCARAFMPFDVIRQGGNIPLYFDFRALLNRWAGAFGEQNIIPRIYSRDALINGDVIDDFLQVTGIECHGARDPLKKNASLSAEAQATLLWINQRITKANPASAKALRREMIAYLLANRSGDAGRPQMAEAKAFYHAFKVGNEAVARRWFGKNTLFDDDFSEYPVKKQVVDTERVLDIVAEFMLNRKAL